MDSRARSFLAALLGVVALGGSAGSCGLHMPGRSFRGPMPTLDAVEMARAARLTEDVAHLAGTIGERNVPRAPSALRAAEDYVAGRLREVGCPPLREPFALAEVEVANLACQVAGSDLSDEIVVIGAHYDSAPGTPGADDNASGVAALLALAEHFVGTRPQRTLRFVAFTNEEPPWFHSEQMGSLVYARAHADERMVAMLSLETLGYYRDEPRTQHYPRPMNLFYPNVGNFVGFVGNSRSARLVRRVVGVFRTQARIPSQGGAVPGSIPGVSWSDHWSFWQVGVPAVMVTDTAPNRNPSYHETTDTPDKVDAERLSLAVTGLVAVIDDLASSDRL